MQEQPPSRQSQDDALQREIEEALGDASIEQLMAQSEPPAEPHEDEASAKPARQSSQRIEHQLKRGRITGIQGDDVFVELAGLDAKNQGIVPLTQFERPPRVGSIMDFVVERIDDKEGVTILSREGAVSRATWDHLAPGAVVEARVTATNKGGLELEMVGNIPAFMPASQVDLHYVENLTDYVGQKLIARVQEINRKGKKVLLSRRQHLEAERELKRASLWEQLEVGQVRDGTVSSVVDYGAFVDIGGADGLIHISDLSYTHVKHPSEAVHVGQAVKVKVLKIDQAKNRISLGLKQVAPDPWETLEQRIKQGDQISGRVLRVADFGAFVEVEAGIEGLLPISEMSWKRVGNPHDVVKEGDVLRLGVLSVDLSKRRISLSLKQAQGDPWIGATVKYARNTVVEAKVISIADFGAFVELEPGIEGLVHISELSDQRVHAVGDVVKVGDRKQLRVLEVDEDNRRVRLSLKSASKELPAPSAAPTAAENRHGRVVTTTPAASSKTRKPGGKPLKGGIE
jgi:small subunit ribosomal protein S1